MDNYATVYGDKFPISHSMPHLTTRMCPTYGPHRHKMCGACTSLFTRRQRYRRSSTPWEERRISYLTAAPQWLLSLLFWCLFESNISFHLKWSIISIFDVKSTLFSFYNYNDGGNSNIQLNAVHTSIIDCRPKGINGACQHITIDASKSTKVSIFFSSFFFVLFFALSVNIVAMESIGCRWRVGGFYLLP